MGRASRSATLVLRPVLGVAAACAADPDPDARMEATSFEVMLAHLTAHDGEEPRTARTTLPPLGSGVVVVASKQTDAALHVRLLGASDAPAIELADAKLYRGAGPQGAD